jgi:hypothetical protein
VGNAEGFGESGYVEGKFISGLRIILPPLALPVDPVVDIGEGSPAA